LAAIYKFWSNLEALLIAKLIAKLAKAVEKHDEPVKLIKFIAANYSQIVTASREYFLALYS
jgi:hypothetical protein